MYIKGFIQSGNGLIITPLSNYNISLYGSLLDKSEILSITTSDSSGYFMLEIQSYLSDNYGMFYLIGRSNENKKITLMTIIGKNLLFDYNLIINELTTVISCYCFAQFFDGNNIFGKYQGLNIAYMMCNNFVKNDGTLSDIIQSSPNGGETNTLKLCNSISNLLVTCIESEKILDKIISIVIPFNSAVKDIINIILNLPKLRSTDNNNYVDIVFKYTLIKNKRYFPFLIFVSPPDSFTLALKVNNTGNNDYLFGGPANGVFDKDGNYWITNNVIQGTNNSSNFSVILQPDGKPAQYSPIVDDRIVGQAFGIVKYYDNIIISNFGWGNVLPNGGIIIINSITKELNFYNDDLFRVQGIAIDLDKNVWILSYQNNKIVVLIGGSVENKATFDLVQTEFPFALVVDSNNVVAISVTYSNVSFVIRLKLENNVIVLISKIQLDSSNLLGIAVDSNNNLYVCSASNDTIYKIFPNNNNIALTGPSISTPWGCTVDSNDNLWIANFSSPTRIRYGVTHIDRFGNTLSPINTGYTLPTGGNEVLLADGTPLYGTGVEGQILGKCFIPLMRATSAQIDMAGNVWVANNWKPNALNDVIFNPGGDGIVIFIGLAGKKDKY